MRKRAFGPRATPVSIVGQGTWRVKSPRKGAEAIRAGIERGLTHVDTAELYEQQSGSESMLGPVLAEYGRDSLYVASKVLPHHATFEGTLKACDATLRRLGLRYLDLYYLHWWSDEVPVRETMRAMEQLVDDGKVRDIGVSNFDVADLEQAEAALRKHPLAANQVLYHLEARAVERELIPFCAKKEIAFVAYSPFAHGRLPTGKAGRVLADVAAKRGASVAQVVLAFLARDPAVFPIPKAESVEHVRANAAALDVVLDAADVAAIDAAFPVPEDPRLFVD